MRQNLISLLQTPHKAEELRKAGKDLPTNDGCVEEIIADFLLLNGVTIQPPKPQTNFDKITSSVESLAELLAGVVDCNVCPCGNKNCVGFTTCKERIKDWLQNEVTENE